MKINTDFLKKLPEFSERNFLYATYVSSALIGCASLYFLYVIFTTPSFGIEVEWNMFKSTLFSPLFIIGIITAIVKWGSFGHWSRTPLIVTKDANGNPKKVEKDYDIIETIFWSILFPFIGHFVIEPCVYAAIIYYPLMVVGAAVSAVLNYVIAAALIAIVVCLALYGKRLTTVRAHSTVIVALTILLAGGLSYAGYCISEPGTTTVQDENNGTPQPTTDDEAAPTTVTAQTDKNSNTVEVATIKFGTASGWQDSVDGVYDSWEKKTETRSDEDGEYTVTFYQFKQDGKVAIEAYTDNETGNITNIEVLTANVLFENGLHVGSPASAVYDAFTPTWDCVFEESPDYNVQTTHANVTYCIPSNMVVEGKDMPESLSDIKADATISRIMIWAPTL